MNNNQTTNNTMMKKLNIHTLSMLVLVASLSACSLSKPGDKERSSMLKEDGSFQGISIKKKTPGNGSTTGDSGNDVKDNAELESASYSSGETVSLAQFFNDIAPECKDNKESRKIVNISGKIGLNIAAVEELFKKIQAESKASVKPEFKTVVTGMFGQSQAEKILKGDGEPIVQWVNYCQSSSDDNKVYGWITDNTLRAKKTAYIPSMHNQFEAPKALSLAWAQYHLIHNVLNIKSAVANDDIDVSQLGNIEVAVYPLIDSHISNDNQVIAKYIKTAEVGALPTDLQLRYDNNSENIEAISARFNENFEENEKIIFSAGELVVGPTDKTRLDGHTEVTFANEGSGSSTIKIDAVVLNEDGKTPNKRNFFTRTQLNLKEMPGAPSILINSGNSKVIVPKPEDVMAFAGGEQSSVENDDTAGNTSGDETGADPADDATNSTTSTNSNEPAANTAGHFYQPPSWVTGNTPSNVVQNPNNVNPAPVNQPKATADPNLNPFTDIGFQCPQDYNLVSLELSCNNCLSAALEDFGWAGKSQSEIQSSMYYQTLESIFGPEASKYLLFSAKDSARHTLNLCFNDSEFMGSYTDNNFQETNRDTKPFFTDNTFTPIDKNQNIITLNGEKHLLIDVSYMAFYTAYPEAVNRLKVVRDGAITNTPAGETLFYQLSNDGTEYITNENANQDITPNIPVDPSIDYLARSKKKLQFIIPLNDLANLHQNINSKAIVKIGAENGPIEEGYPQSQILKLFADDPSDPNDQGIDYLIAGKMPITAVRYRKEHNQEIYQSLGAQIIAANSHHSDPNTSLDPVDLASFQENMQDGSAQVENVHPGNYFKQPPSNAANFPGTLITHASMIETCNNYAYKFGVGLKGKYTLVNGFEGTHKEISDLSHEIPSLKELLVDLVMNPIKRIADNSKNTYWNIYVCTNTLDKGILSSTDYVAFLDTLPNASDDIAGVFKISNPHSNIVIGSNSSKTKLLVGLDIVSFDVHDGDRLGRYLDLGILVVPAIKQKPPTRMTFQFTGQIPLDSRDIKKSSKAVGSRFHFAKNLRRLPFELDPVNHVFDVSANTTNNASESVVLKTPVHLHKNSLHYQGNIESFPGIDDPSAQPFDGFIQSFGELSAVQLGFWLEG